jgi:hypothetical protein
MTTISEEDRQAFETWRRKQGFFAGDVKLLGRALDQDLDVFARILLGKGAGFGRLAEEIRAGNDARAEKLLRFGIDPHEEVKRGGAADPALEEACRRNNTRMAALLLEAGYNVDHQGYAGRTALIAAALRGHRPCIELLIGHNADPTIRDSDGDDALKCARIRKKAVASLLEEYARGWQASRTPMKLLPAPERKPEPMPTADGWSCAADIVTRTVSDAASGTRIKNIFDFAAKQMITEVTSTGCAPQIISTPFSAVDAEFLAAARAKRDGKSQQPGLM